MPENTHFVVIIFDKHLEYVENLTLPDMYKHRMYDNEKNDFVL